MRVLVVTVVHVPWDARIFQRQIGAMRDAGVDVTYAAPWSACGEQPPSGLATLDVPRATGRSRVAAIRAARDLLRREADRHDLVMIHDPELLLAVAAATPSTPVVWDVHEDVAASIVARPWIPSALRPPARFGARIAEWWAERRLHLVLAEESYQTRFSDRHPVVPNAPIVPETAEEPGHDRVVYVGRVAGARGARELIELGGQLRGEVAVEIIGDAEPDVEEELGAAHRRGDVVWVGYLPNDQALERVRGALAGVSLLHDLPNFRGSMPTKVLEYMACGIPVVTTPLPLAAEVVREAHAGVVVPFGDVAAAAEAIRGLRRDADRRRAAGRRARQLVSSRYSWEAEATRFVGILRGWARRPIDLPPLPAEPTVSVVIPARDSAATLPQAVRSALRQPVDEIVVAVGPSTDGTSRMAREQAAEDGRIRVVDNPSGTTPAALNAAIGVSRGEVVVRLDAHAELPEGYVDRAIRTLRRTGAASVGGRQHPVADHGFARAVAAAMSSPAGAGGAAYRTGTQEGPVDTVYLGVFRRAALEAVGGFDERMVRNQDYELNVRLRERGGTVWYDPELAVDYSPRSTVPALAEQYFDYGRWRRMTLRLHPGSLRARQLAAPVVVVGLAGGALFASAAGRWWPLAATWGAYGAGLVVAGLDAADRPRRGPAVAVALAVMHVSWGLGFLAGPPSTGGTENGPDPR
ncbi:MAG: glycosyltransferase [Nitriliruptorales bacterium]|nr:glycosyltransferase [Nitriliruptorales bacterium]